MCVMLYYSHKSLKYEAFSNAEQTVETTFLRVDNILLSVEQASGNFYWDIVRNLHNPVLMETYVRKLVESDPQITGAAIAFEPYYYRSDEPYTMFYAHHARGTAGKDGYSAEIVMSSTFGSRPYTEQRWYVEPIQKKMPCWVNPLKNDDTEEDDALLTFSLPLYDATWKLVGVLGVDVQLETLSDIILSTKPSPNSYALMLGSDGSFIVHPDVDNLKHQTVFTIDRNTTDPDFLEAMLAMMNGETGQKAFDDNGMNCLLFYKPFQRDSIPGRSMADLGWSIGVVYPECDIYRNYYRLLFVVIVIVVVSLLLLLAYCRTVTHRQLKPLRQLSAKAQRIAEGEFYDDSGDGQGQEPAVASEGLDEVGRLQKNFQQMQQALAQHIGELEQLTSTLKERGERLEEAYERAKEADRMKTAFLHNMTNQMMVPVDTIFESAQRLASDDKVTAAHDSAVIQAQSKIITVVLNDLLNASSEKAATTRTTAEAPQDDAGQQK